MRLAIPTDAELTPLGSSLNMSVEPIEAARVEIDVVHISWRGRGAEMSPMEIHQQCDLAALKTPRVKLSLVPSPESRSRDLVGMGFIRRVPGDDSQVRSPHGYAELGLWYDALASTLEPAGDLTARRAARDVLLRGAGLGDVAERLARSAPAPD